VLADRGLTNNESVGFHCAVLTPALTIKIASVRIHFECIIGFIRSKLKILNGPIQLTTLKYQEDETCLLDSIVTVCCGLINMCSSEIP